MTKAEVVNEIVEKTGIERVVVANSLEMFMKVVKNNMARGENVYLRGFGTFLCKKRAAKMGRNITKKETVFIAPHYTPIFKPAKPFADKVRKGVKVD